jgi:hypothetical protein
MGLESTSEDRLYGSCGPASIVSAITRGLKGIHVQVSRAVPASVRACMIVGIWPTQPHLNQPLG